MHAVLSLVTEWLFTPGWELLVYVVADVLALVTIPSVLLQRRGRPMAALSWILAVIGLPFVGVVAWWMLGRIHLRRHTTRRHRIAEEVLRPGPRDPGVQAAISSAFTDVLPFATTTNDSRKEGCFPPTANNRVQLFVDGEAAYAAMEAAIRSARREINMLFYIWNTDATGNRIRDALVERARAGVQVRLLVDAIGGAKVKGKYVAELRAAGGAAARFLPARFRPWAPTFNFRNHRKILVVDRSIAFTGGMNIGDEYAREWHDLMVGLRGPAVAQLNEVFREDWAFVTKEDLGRATLDDDWPEPVDDAPALCGVVASGPDRIGSRMHDAFFLAIARAGERVWITTPYFVPSPQILGAVRSAAQRGVDVRLLVPHKNDLPFVQWASRSYYTELLDTGVRVFEYEPRILHAKSLVIDRDLSVIGTANVDGRSFALNFEVGCFFRSEQLNARLAAVYEHDMTQSIEIDPARAHDKTRTRALLESAAHLVSPLI